MFSSDQNIEKISKLLTSAKEYGDMRIESIERSFVEKLSTLLSGLVISAVIFIVSLIVVVFVSAAVVVGIAPYVGGTLVALLIVSAFYTLVMCIVYAKRRTLLIIPVKMALDRIFFAELAEKPAPTAEDLQKAKQTVIDQYDTLTAPPPPANNRFEQALQTASKAWSIADGVIMGYKLYKRFNSLFGKGRRRR